MLSNFYPASEKSIEIERDLDVISSLQLHEVQVNVREVDQFQYRSKILFRPSCILGNQARPSSYNKIDTKRKELLLENWQLDILRRRSREIKREFRMNTVQ